MLTLALSLLLFACAGRDVRPNRDPIRERAECPMPGSYKSWMKEFAPPFEEDVKEAGLGKLLEKRPVESLFPKEEYKALKKSNRNDRCERIVYESSGLDVVGYLFHPEPDGRQHPVIVYARGGNRDYGSINTSTLMLFQELARAGYVVVATQYRGVEGMKGQDEYGGSDVADLHRLVDVVKALPNADPDRIFLLGVSRGAMQSLIALRNGFPAHAAAFRSGMYDLRTNLQERPDVEEGISGIIPGFEKNEDKALHRRSPVEWADEIETPILMFHGTDDVRVSLGIAKSMNKALPDDTPHELVIYKDDEHQLAFHRDEWVEETLDWFRKWDPARQ